MLVRLNMAHLYYRLVCDYSDLIGRLYKLLQKIINNGTIKSRWENNPSSTIYGVINFIYIFKHEKLSQNSQNKSNFIS